MGNTAAVSGHAANYVQDGAAMLGVEHQALGFQGTAKAVMRLHGIESWNSRSLIAERLQRQLELAQRSPLRLIGVEQAIVFMSEELRRLRSGISVAALWSGLQQGVRIQREEFVEACWHMLLGFKDQRERPLSVTQQDRDDLYSIFDSMDFDKNGTLGVGEWAGLCSVFFRGSTEECLRAVFKILDEDGSDTLTHREVQEYLRSYVKALMPESAAALEPMLLKRTTDKIFQEMDADSSGSVTSEELLAWTNRGQSIIDALADIIDSEVYAVWIQDEHRRMQADETCAQTAIAQQEHGAKEGAAQPSGMLGLWGAWHRSPGPAESASTSDGGSPRPSNCSSEEVPATPLRAECHMDPAAAQMDHFQATAAQWSAVPAPPPPPPPPQRVSNRMLAPCTAVAAPLPPPPPQNHGSASHAPYYGMNYPSQPQYSSSVGHAPHYGMNYPSQPQYSSSVGHAPHYGMNSPSQPQYSSSVGHAPHYGTSNPAQPQYYSSVGHAPHYGMGYPGQ